MPAKDRTSEFHAALASIRSRSSLHASSSAASSSSNLLRSGGTTVRGAGPGGEARQPLLAPGADGHLGLGGSRPTSRNGSKNNAQVGQVSEFGKMAGGIAKDINNTTMKLQKLAQLAKRRTLFDDRPIEISELTYIIRQDIASLNNQIAALQSYVRAQKAGGGAGGKGRDKGKGQGQQVEEHNSNVVMLLQSRLASMGMGFKDVLELRTQNMKASKDRTEQFMHTSSPAVPLANQNSILFSQPPPGSSGMGMGVGGPGSGFAGFAGAEGDRKGKGRAVADLSGVPSTSVSGRTTPAGRPGAAGGGGGGGGSTGGGREQDFLALDIDGDRGESGVMKQGEGGYQQMQLVEQQDNYIQSRSTAIESIESTIAELGQIFTQLAGMVAEQRETVQRIDADTTDIAANVTGAQRELLKYYASVTSNRWLMLKIFGVLIIFFLVFILVS